MAGANLFDKRYCVQQFAALYPVLTIGSLALCGRVYDRRLRRIASGPGQGNTEREKTMPATKVKPGSIQIGEIREKAKSIGITPGKMKKAELIRAIQTAEGNQPCFGRSGGECIYTNCCFIQDCLKTRL
jgi:hypothetical protein